MKSRSFCSQSQPMPANSCRLVGLSLCTLLCVLIAPRFARAGDAPAWMHAAASAPVPAHDEKTDAVLMYEDISVNVISADKVKTHVREVYKILRPEGRDYGIASVDFTTPSEKVTSLHGWCIPAQGKDYEVKDKEAIEASPRMIPGIELVEDVREKFLRIPAPDPGNFVGYEYDREEQPLVLQDSWQFQQEIPVRETHYSLQLPSGWAYKASWLNHPEVKPTEMNGQLSWTVSDIPAIRREEEMPPWRGVAGQMIVSYFPQGGATGKAFSTWQDMGAWYWNLIQPRQDASDGIKQQVASLTASKTTPLQKMQALAQFVQHDVRYVAIELGIGGWQPHPAADVFSHRYGDCKDKATLMRSMLHEIGIDSYPVAINMDRGSVTQQTPAHLGGFNHQITAIKLPNDLQDPLLVAVWVDPKLGRLLFFDPTNELVPFGQLPGYLQANYGLLVTPNGGELVELPQEPTAMNSIARKGTFTLDAIGTLKGEINETRLGDRAWMERMRLHNVTNSKDRIKPMEDLLSGSLALYQITKASLVNLNYPDRPFGFDYSFEAANYAKDIGGLLLVRPRVVGAKAQGFLETKEPRKFPIEFDAPVRDTDTFDIAIPQGFVVDDIPPAVDVDDGFASYHAKTELQGNSIHYSRTFEIKELSVPVARADELKKFYRIINTDERNTVVLKQQGK